jgi:hypothetical protein
MYHTQEKKDVTGKILLHVTEEAAWGKSLQAPLEEVYFSGFCNSSKLSPIFSLFLSVF